MRIRQFQIDDSVPLASLYFKTVRRINIRDYTQVQVEAWAPESRDMDSWRLSFDHKSVFVAYEGETLLGFGELEPNGHIDRFYVDADSIGKGIGKRIYAAIENRARDQKLTRLFAEVSFTAKPFFIQMGFSSFREQAVNVRGTVMNNFVMEKFLATHP